MVGFLAGLWIGVWPRSNPGAVGRDHNGTVAAETSDMLPSAGRGQSVFLEMQRRVARRIEAKSNAEAFRRKELEKERVLRSLGEWQKAVELSLTNAETQGEPSIGKIRDALSKEGIPVFLRADLTRLIYSDVTELARYEGWALKARAEYEDAMTANEASADPGFAAKVAGERVAFARELSRMFLAAAVERLSSRSSISRKEFFDEVYSIRPTNPAMPLFEQQVTGR
jgi:hypothetical protein